MSHSHTLTPKERAKIAKIKKKLDYLKKVPRLKARLAVLRRKYPAHERSKKYRQAIHRLYGGAHSQIGTITASKLRKWKGKSSSSSSSMRRSSR